MAAFIVKCYMVNLGNITLYILVLKMNMKVLKSKAQNKLLFMIAFYVDCTPIRFIICITMPVFTFKVMQGTSNYAYIL